MHVKLTNIPKKQPDLYIVIENQLDLIITKERTIFKFIKTQKQKIKIKPQISEFDKDILLTFPYIGVKFLLIIII